MKTLTPEQFKQQFGAESLTKFGTQPSTPSYLQRVGGDIKNAFQESNQSSIDSADGKLNPLSAGINIAKNISSAALSPITEAIAPIISPVVKPVYDYISKNTKDLQAVKDFQDLVQKHPVLAQTLGDLTQATLNVAGVKGVAGSVPKVFNTTKSAATKMNTALDSTLERASIKGGELLDSTVSPAQIMNRVARLNPTDEIKFTKLSGQTPGEYLTKTGNFGAPDKIISNEAIKFTNSIKSVDDTLASLPGTYKNGAVADALRGLAKKSASISTKNVPSSFRGRLGELIKKYNEGGLEMKEINEVKRLFEKNVKLGYNKLLNADEVSKATNIDSAIRKWQVDKARDLGFSNIDALNKQTQISKFILDKLGSKVIGQSALNSIGLTDWIVLAGGNPTAVAGFLTKKFFSSKGVQAKIAELVNQGKIEGQILPKTSITPEFINRQINPQGNLALPAPANTTKTIQGLNPIELRGASSIESSSPKATRTTINRKTGDQYIKDLKTGKTRIIPSKKK